MMARGSALRTVKRVWACWTFDWFASNVFHFSPVLTVRSHSSQGAVSQQWATDVCYEGKDVAVGDGSMLMIGKIERSFMS
jgi:hypothetical protein